jgi:hypothetical protein
MIGVRADWDGVTRLLLVGAVLVAFGGGWWSRWLTSEAECQRSEGAASRLVLQAMEADGDN